MFFFVFFQLLGHTAVNWWAAVQRIKHGVRPFYSHQLTGMCNTAQPAAGYACQRVLASVCTTSVALRWNMCEDVCKSM